MHRFLTEHPRFQRAVKEAEKVRRRSVRFREHAAREEREFRVARDQYEADARRALDSGGPQPVPLIPPVVDGVLAQTLASEAVTADRFELDACTELAPELLPQLAERALELELTIREAVDLMRGVAAEATQVRVTAERLRRAGGLPGLDDPGAVDVLALVSLMVRGDRLLAAPLPSPESAGPAGEPQRPPVRQTSRLTLVGRR